jgi:hypothetical protein
VGISRITSQRSNNGKHGGVQGPVRRDTIFVRAKTCLDEPDVSHGMLNECCLRSGVAHVELAARLVQTG